MYWLLLVDLEYSSCCVVAGRMCKCRTAATCLVLCREENVVAIDLITQHIRMKLQQPDLRRIYHSLELIPSNYQIRGMHTILRDQKTNKTDFVFIADRLLRLVRLYRCKQRCLEPDACLMSSLAASCSNLETHEQQHLYRQ